MAKKTAEIELKLINSQFRSQCSVTSQTMKSLRSEFKLNESQFKATGDKAEYLKNKSDILTKQYETQKQKVEDTRTALEKTVATMGENSKEADKLKVSLNYAESEMHELKVKAEEAKDELNKFSAAGEKLDNISSKTKGLSDNIQAVSIAAAAVATASIAAWNNLDDGYDNIILKTGATGDALDGLNQSFDNVFTNLPEDVGIVSDAIGEVNTRFKVTGEDLEELSDYMIKFSKITGSDVNTATGTAAKIMAQWNLTQEETCNLLGLIAKQSQDTGISVDTLMNAVQDNGYIFKEMGLSVGESVNLLANFEAAGIESDAMLTGLKKAATNYAKEGKSMNQGLGDLVGRLQNASTYQEAYNEVTDLFGSKAALSFATAAREGRFSLDNLSSDLSNYGTVVNDTYGATLDPIDNCKIAFNKLQIAGSELGGSILESVAPAITALGDGVSAVTEWFRGLDSNTQQFIGTSVVFVAGLSTMLLGISGVAKIGSIMANGFGALKKVISLCTVENIKNAGSFITSKAALVGHKIACAASAIGTTAMTVATGAWNVVCTVGTALTTAFGAAVSFLTSPIGLVVIAITALIGAGILLYQNWETVKTFGEGIWNGITSFVGGCVDNISSFFSKFSGITSTAGNIFNGIKDAICNPIDTAKGLIETGINFIKGLFNFQITWPKIKMPSIDVVWKKTGLLAEAAKFLGFEGLPTFKINWNAKGGLFTKPTVMQGFGEAGHEYAIPLNEKSVQPLANMIVDLMNKQNSMENMILNTLGQMKIEVFLDANIDGTPLEAKISKRQAISFRRAQYGGG